MSNALFKCIATVVVALTVGLPVTLGFAATPGPSTGGLGEHATPPALANSRDDSALLVAENLAPGESRSETVTITNQGGAPASFELSKAGLQEKPGLGGGKLSAELEICIEDVTKEQPLATVNCGAVGSMTRRTLGTFAAGESRTYRFAAPFPDGGAPSSASSGDNAYMGASLVVDFHRTARQ